MISAWNPLWPGSSAAPSLPPHHRVCKALQERAFRCTILRFALCGLLIGLMVGHLHAAGMFSSARGAVYFSPNGDATAAIVKELNAAQTQVLMQAYAFTSAPMAQALVEAQKRGVKILAVLDKS